LIRFTFQDFSSQGSSNLGSSNVTQGSDIQQGGNLNSCPPNQPSWTTAQQQQQGTSNNFGTGVTQKGEHVPNEPLTSLQPRSDVYGQQQNRNI